MSLPIRVTAGNHAAPGSERGLEVYATPPGAVGPLVDNEPLPSTVWNCCGTEDDAITRVLRARGKDVITTDIRAEGIDLLNRAEAPPGVRVIVCNPPFSKAADFVRRGLLLVPKDVILQRAQFWRLPPKDRKCSRQRVLELFPAAHALLARKRDHGRAEAALIALYGIRSSRVIAVSPIPALAGIPGNLGCNTVTKVNT